ncbi:MAG TPA: CDP-alcohol phosphatidyltransferase family protein [Actinomycetota bacterium]|nr:CDP-alcohol phosphatidyltransferase family protein [Actinomycetota bacterium]
MSGLYSIKPWFVRRLRRLEDFLVEHRVSPDTLSVAAVGVSVAAGAALAAGGILSEPLLWLVVPPLGVVRLALNALDGAVARRIGDGRPFGEVVNEMADRLADVAMLAPLAAVVEPALAFSALTCALLASAAGCAGRAVTGRRIAGGPMGKADRVAVIAIAGAAAVAASSPVPFEVAAWVIAAGSVLTTGLRLGSLSREEVAADAQR